MADVKMCDRCRTLYPKLLKNPYIGIFNSVTNNNYDLCSECIEKLNMFLKGADVMGEEYVDDGK